MPKKKQTAKKSNLLWWIIGAVILIGTAFVVFRHITSKDVYFVPSCKVERTQGQKCTCAYHVQLGELEENVDCPADSYICETIDKQTVICKCDIIIGKEHHNFTRIMDANTCDNNVCNDWCKHYAAEFMKD